MMCRWSLNLFSFINHNKKKLKTILLFNIKILEYNILENPTWKTINSLYIDPFRIEYRSYVRVNVKAHCD